jgi:hypothetical protein
MAYLYRHIRLDKNQPFYIGIGSSEYYNRAYRHKQRSELWKRIASKGGYRVEILLDDLTWDEVREKEKEFIKLYGRIDLKTGCLANMTDGGDGTINAIISKENREKVAEANRRRIFTEEDRRNMSIRYTGRKKSDEAKKKLSNSLRNSQKFKDAIKRNSEKFKGFKHSEETKKKLSELRSKKIIQKTLDGEFIKIWDSAKQAQIELGLHKGNISKCCNGQYKKASGYKWEYYKQ